MEEYSEVDKTKLGGIGLLLIEEAENNENKVSKLASLSKSTDFQDKVTQLI